MKKQRIYAIPLLLSIILSSCVFSGGQELYSMPAPAREHTRLQEKLDVLIAEGWEYSAPIGGPSPSALRFIDIFGNGVPEAAAFFKHTSSRTLKMCIYAQTRDGGDYDLIAEIEGEGDQIECAYFNDMDGDGIVEIIIGFRLSTGAVGGLKVYTLQDGSSRELLNTEYTGLYVTDFTSDSNTDLLLLRHSESAENARAMLYTYDGRDLYLKSETHLSAQAKTPDKITFGTVDGGLPAVAVDAAFGERRYITDFLVCDHGTLRNVTYDDKYHFSQGSLKDILIHSERTLDGGLEVSQTVELNPTVMDGLFRVNWSRYINGEMSFRRASVHDYQFGWQFDLPARWSRRVIVERSTDDTGNAVQTLFLAESGQKPRELLLSLWVFLGEERLVLAEEAGAFILKETDNAVYAARIYTPDDSFSEYAISRGAVMELFRFDAADAGLWRVAE